MANEVLIDSLDRVSGAVVKGEVVRKVGTGVEAVDQLLGGGIALNSSLVFVSGESGCGVSGLMFQTALNVASGGTRVLFYALESDADCAAARLVRTATGLDAAAQLNAEQRIKYADAAGALKGLPLELHAVDGTNICMINDDVKCALDSPREPLVVVIDGGDYIACCNENELASSLKSIAIEWHVPILCGVASSGEEGFLAKARLCDEAVYLQVQEGGDVAMRLAKSRTRACRDVPPAEARLDPGTLTFAAGA